ncbi:MAG: 4'-phosphopantetheinyl transferase superfamily protein [Methylibium sp.]|uniref:4'-phosphopantetheinyl transferase superfamily protein n=1 Tax=Methylibium sp. TaxID=2067992 RepID=UPI00178E0244|nr:4'-phosphopantetheinyl transferase superfamily protein [Methylibium sp.]MBA3598148.1 4'-phosphopantetheinyl transferase superfamily protein [Methylibium sp.]
MKLLRGMLPAGAVGALRRIRPQDEQLLTAAETASLPARVAVRRRASGAARALARELFAAIGLEATDLVRRPGGMPAWPQHAVGSLAHDDVFAAAVVGRSDVLGGMGLDIERIEPPDEDLLALVASPLERRSMCDGGTLSPVEALFSIKEAVFKAVYPHDRMFLDFDDILIDVESRSACTCYGRHVAWRMSAQHRIMAIAWW